MQPKAGQSHVADFSCFFQTRQNAGNLVHKVRLQATAITTFEQQLQPLWRKLRITMSSVTLHHSSVN